MILRFNLLLNKYNKPFNYFEIDLSFDIQIFA